MNFYEFLCAKRIEVKFKLSFSFVSHKKFYTHCICTVGCTSPPPSSKSAIFDENSAFFVAMESKLLKTMTSNTNGR